MYFKLNYMKDTTPTVAAASVVASLGVCKEDTAKNIFEMINNHCTFAEQNYILGTLKDYLVIYREDFLKRVNEDLLSDMELLAELKQI